MVPSNASLAEMSTSCLRDPGGTSMTIGVHRIRRQPNPTVPPAAVLAVVLAGLILPATERIPVIPHVPFLNETTFGSSFFNAID